ncbi:peptidase [Endozoicomonas sp. OPT23]|uniref:zinc metallopeptidase n=1 Tax=Endozoicomonas sp. OPT23 TaxID=2072845 RepID=UPI00129A74D1|nr:zinc metallopeptidase [Endozoicomonas sp. OPT23]MRI32884.1 peptidase [Endozoicomonas sp. OPT23]
MHFALLGLLIILLVVAPQYWVKRTLNRHGSNLKAMPGTGGELANHLIERFELSGVTVVKGGQGEDYYDPSRKLISLSPQHYEGRSVAAVAIAAHETSHALQDQENNPDFLRREKRIRLAVSIQQFSSIALMISPLIFLLTRAPHSMLLTALIGISGMVAAIWVQFLNLPIELDASFKKALPILSEGYLPDEHLPAANEVLKAAAYTYVAAALASVVNLARWVAILRR